jgi:pyruvate dehydrogenase E2 component (dihydrolipoamide acetyltransferase)
VSRDVPADGLLAVVRQRRSAGGTTTVTDLLVKAFALALTDVLGEPEALGLAVATDRGVATPVLPRPARTGLDRIAELRAAAATRARAGRMSADDALVPIATLSNLGSMGVRSFTGVIPLGQRMLLTTGAVQDRLILDADGLRRRHHLDATLTLDHRHLDGAHAARILARLCELAERPDELDAAVPSTADDRRDA